MCLFAQESSTLPLLLSEARGREMQGKGNRQVQDCTLRLIKLSASWVDLSRGVAPIQGSDVAVMGAAEGVGCAGEDSGTEVGPPIPSVTLRNGAIPAAGGVVRLRGGRDDVFHHLLPQAWSEPAPALVPREHPFKKAVPGLKGLGSTALLPS